MYRTLSPRYLSCLLAASVLLFGSSGCGVLKKFFSEEIEKSPEELMAEGTGRFERGDYQAATESFQKVKDRYPYSKFVISAELMIADSMFKTKEYDKAFDAYDEFERLHPKDKNIPYVIYQKGMSHFEQIRSVDRDQKHTLKAKEEFERLVKQFPRDDYANRARRNMRECLIYLAEHELKVGHFYYDMGKYSAAMERFRYIIQNYPDMGQYHEALEYMSRCKDRLSKAKP